MMPSSVQVGLLSKLRPTVNFANQMAAFPGQEWGPRIIPDCQLLHVLSGKAKLSLGLRQYNLAAGDYVFYGSDSPHHLVSSKSDPFTFASIHYRWHQVSPKPVHPEYGIRTCIAGESSKPARNYIVHVNGYGEVEFPHYFTSSALEHLFLQVVREYRFEEPGYTSVLRGLLSQLLVMILRQQINGQQSPAARRKIAPALEVIRKQPNVSWKAEKLAGLCGYHPTYFAQLFKEATGHSPKHYLILERIRKAKSLLLEAGTVEEAAERLGYTSLHYFCRNFKEVTGLTPTEFKRRSIEL